MIFNQTFSAEKPVYYPSNWETGKTALQLHEEWKLTLNYAVLSNLFQVIGGAMWCFLVVLIAMGLRYILKLYMMDEGCPERRANRKYLRGEFIGSLAFFGISTVIVTCILMREEWLRFVFVKGIGAWGLFFLGKKIKELFRQAKRNKLEREFQALKKKDQSLMTESEQSSHSF